MIIMIMTMMVTVMMIIMMTNGHLIQELEDQVELLISMDNIEELGGRNPIVIIIIIIIIINIIIVSVIVITILLTSIRFIIVKIIRAGTGMT